MKYKGYTTAAKASLRKGERVLTLAEAGEWEKAADILGPCGFCAQKKRRYGYLYQDYCSASCPVALEDMGLHCGNVGTRWTRAISAVVGHNITALRAHVKWLRGVCEKCGVKP